mgnify:CR=1 FL=1
MLKVLHFADAHIDMAQGGVHDPATGLPVRVMDYLRSLDTIVETAIAEQVDLVIFAGDTYRDRSPQPTYQREWGRRMMQLSKAQIPTLMVTGNHDISPSHARAHAMQEYETLQPPFIHVVNQPAFMGPSELDGAQVQVIVIPWMSRAQGIALKNHPDYADAETPEQALESFLSRHIELSLAQATPNLPLILAAHASVQGARYGKEREISIGRELVLQPGFVRDPRFDYVALGHIHKFQDLNPGMQPPVIYAGSIERVDLGEVGEEKGFVVAEVSKGATRYEWRPLATRKMIDLFVPLSKGQPVLETVLAAFPEPEELQDSILRLRVRYPRDLEAFIDEAAIRQRAKGAFDFHLVREPEGQSRARLDAGKGTAALGPLELLDLYWREAGLDEAERQRLGQQAADLIGGDEQPNA